MTRDEHRLYRHLALAVVLKLAVLALLWWLFVRDTRVNLDTDRVAARLAGASATPATTQGVSK